MGKPLDQTEHYAKWIVAIIVIFGAIKFVWKNLVKAYKYIQESNERQDMLQHIINNQKYSQTVNKAIMDKISLGYFKTDLTGRSVEVGDVVCKIFGYSEEELLSFNWSSMIVEEDRDRVMKSIMSDIEFGRDGDLTYSIRTATGEIKKVHVHTTKTFDSYFGVLTVIK